MSPIFSSIGILPNSALLPGIVYVHAQFNQRRQWPALK
jgi:hypothetical protein